MSQLVNNPFDTDLDAFLNYDHSDQTSMSSSTDVKPVPALLHQSSNFTSNSDAFSAPSYQYDSHRQQTGLPMGGYANTLAINQASGLHYRPSNHGFIVPTDTLNIPLTNLDEFDFNRPQAYDFPEMDVETGSPADVPSMFYGAEGSNGISPATHIPPRIYPGMHTQQANQAKMQQAQKEQEQRQLPPGQKPLPTSAPKSPVVKDPHREETISRLLDRMRQNSNASADDADSPSTGSSNMPRIKKDEDDMDDDERLLNSEEGKKLSSKERRQLRNKVSARAFRSRRKEYINQLEGELAAKAQEANELRVENRQLTEENQRLTDLTRMLLSSQSFSGFLQELSQAGGATSNNQASQQQQAQPQHQPLQQAQPQRQPQQTRKDMPTHEAARQMQNTQNHMQVGMTLIPEVPIDMSIFDNHGSWGNVLHSNDFQVFSVTEMPEPPKIDMSSLSGKSSMVDFKPITSAKKDLPVLSSLPLPSLPAKESFPTIASSSDDLYAEVDAATSCMSVPTFELPMKAASVSSKAKSESESGSWPELHNLCKDLDESCERLSTLLP
ncbi:hypothetical protein LTS08_005386 [Lithohypha guttulata]|nr:hypothetical protein LTS08_005386 [Lithohypha guttulata]